ncbi:putative DNA repair protein complementing XP-G cells-like protein [Hypsibius exemplaris]|uniref:DNA repair protein complementing XP-G cells-like protein n=1 Tax=Hypsibius exemplaris TaxID=2072580 RepID=A0A9X6NK96_HYPEX|nr:putative DNA repair protein complementing XP-G cells-like protein [Hypsibius exemplaris]
MAGLTPRDHDASRQPFRALEIMAEFGGDGVQSLHRFRKWYDQSQQRRRQGDLRPESKLRAQLADLHVPEIFPDNLVVQAYREPDVDRSTEKFTWGLPALDLLREYCRRKFGWKQQKSDEILLPIIKRLNARDTQTHLESFFRVQLERTGSGLVGSRRLGAAIQKIKSGEREAEGDGTSEEEDECGGGAMSQTKRKRVNCTDAGKPTMPSGSETVRSKRKKTARKQPSGPEAVSVSVATVKRKRPQRLRKTCEPLEAAQDQDSVESNEM